MESTMNALGAMIFAHTKKNNQVQHVIDVRGWGAIQNMFKNEEEAAQFQDQVGKFISQAINEKLEKL